MSFKAEPSTLFMVLRGLAVPVGDGLPTCEEARKHILMFIVQICMCQVACKRSQLQTEEHIIRYCISNNCPTSSYLFLYSLMYGHDFVGVVDVVHLLAAREQELRALSAERDQLHSELDLARSLIDERDSDIQQIRTVNDQDMLFPTMLGSISILVLRKFLSVADQYVEENDRLRDIIREWSARAAKLERALEDERISNADLHKKISMLRHSNEE
eukprot:Gb_28742 [translate_table: standard]